MKKQTPETPVEQLPVLTPSNRLLWGRLGASMVPCLLVIASAILFDSCG